MANDQDGSCRLYDGTSLQQTTTIELKDDADYVRYDKTSRRFWVGYGHGGLAAIDAESGKQVADVKLDAHPESFQLETRGKRIFVNVPNAGNIAVIDREIGTVIENFAISAGFTGWISATVVPASSSISTFVASQRFPQKWEDTYGPRSGLACGRFGLV